MADTIARNPISAAPPRDSSRDASLPGNGLDRVFEQLLDPDGVKVTAGVTSSIGEASVNIEASEGSGWNIGGHAEIADEAPFGDRSGPTIGVKSGLHGLDGREGTEVKGTLFGREAVGTLRRGDDGTETTTFEVSLSREAAKSMPGRMLEILPSGARDLIQGPTGLAVDADARLTVTRQTKANGEVTHYAGMKLEASPSNTLEYIGVIDDLDAKAFVQVEAVFEDGNSEFDGADLLPDSGITTFPSERPLDTYGIMSSQTGTDFVHTVDLGMSGGLTVGRTGGQEGSLDTVTSETAAALQSMVREAAALEHDAKAASADSEPERFGHEAAALALREGTPVRQSSMLAADVRTASDLKGDTRNADALIADRRDDGYIDGSNIPEVTIGDRTYAVSPGGGEMHGRTTMTPGEIEARARAHEAGGGAVAADAVAKARADAMAQSLRDGFSARDQVAISGSSVGTDASGALADMIAEARDIEAAKTEHEGGESRGQQARDIPASGSRENDAATSAEFDAMGGVAGPSEDERSGAEATSSSTSRDDHEGGENNGADIGGSDRNDDGTFGADHADPGSSGIL